MLIGEYQHSIDPKGRIFFPARLREDLGDSIVMAQGLDGCIAVYPVDEWKILDAKIREVSRAKSRELQRCFSSMANEAEIDKQGRALIPQKLRDYAGLERDVVIAGVSTHIEIWDRARWEERTAEYSSGFMAQMMEELGL